MSGERINAVGGNIMPDDPSVLHTKIANFMGNPQLHAQLKAKLEQYREREAEFAYMHPDQRITLHGEVQYREIFKEAILAAILEIADVPNRDYEEQPILLPEVALKVMDHPGVSAYKANLAAAITTPFVRNERFGPGYYPDFDSLVEQGDVKSYAFSEAYAIIAEYAANNPSGVIGGKGLPEVSSVSE